MATKVAINGFGRIGRLVARAILERNDHDLELVAINDLADAGANALLFQFDSTHGRFPGSVSVDANALVIDGKKVAVTSEREPGKLPHGDMGVDIVLECTGFFQSVDAAKPHLDAGAKRVLISAPAKGDLKTIVYGVNHETLTGDDHIVSNASCTTNCLAPVAKVMHDTVGIERGFMTTIHSYTNDQRMLDQMHGDMRRARGGAQNMIPTTTGAARAVGLVLPELNGKLDGSSVRVPTQPSPVPSSLPTLGDYCVDYTVRMYDSFGDGWTGVTLYVGGHTFTLDDGSQGTESACLYIGRTFEPYTCDGAYSSGVYWLASASGAGTPEAAKQAHSPARAP